MQVESVRSKLAAAWQDSLTKSQAYANLKGNPRAAAAAAAAASRWDMLSGLLNRGNLAGGGGTHNGNFHGAAASPWPPPPPPPAFPPPVERGKDKPASSAVRAVPRHPRALTLSLTLTPTRT